MKHPKCLILILGDQLDLQSSSLRGIDPETDQIIMIESANEAQYVWTHKAKIALFLSAMRHFAVELEQRGYPLTYIKSSPLPIVEVIREQILKNKVKHLVCIEPGEWRLKQALEVLAKDLGIELEMREDEHFYCSRQEFKEWAANRKEFRLEYFYRLMRKRHNILVDREGNPEGGQWNFDQDNRKPYPKKGPGIIDAPASFEVDAITQEVLDWVQKTYPDHPGSLDAFNWPVTRGQAVQALEYFVEYRLRNFGVYQDAMWTDTPFGWHSILSSALNLKLLNPREVVDAVFAVAEIGVDVEAADVAAYAGGQGQVVDVRIDLRQEAVRVDRAHVLGDEELRLLRQHDAHEATQLLIGAEHGGAFTALEFTHLIGQRGAAVEGEQQLLVYRVNQDAQFGKRFGHGALSVGTFELLHVRHQRLHTFQRHGVVNAGAHAAHRFVTLQLQQSACFGARQEGLVA